MKKLFLTAAIALLVWSGLALYGQAQANDVTRLESRVSRLESQITRLQSELNQQSSRTTGAEQAFPDSSAPISPFPDDPTPEEQFDNLATLAIELKQQVRALEDRVSQLEGTSVETP